MGIDYYVCNSCGEAFPDVIDYGWCEGCSSTFCSSCKEDYLDEGCKYDEEDGVFLECPECNKPTLDKKKFETLMYFLVKDAAKYGFSDFLEEAELSEEDYDGIKRYLEETHGIKMYL